MKVFVGLDCGGSSSRVLAVDEFSNVLFQGQSGAANLVSTPAARLSRNLTAALEGCPPPSYLCGCFAGLINEEIRRGAVDLLRSLCPEANLRAEPDYTAALYACPEETDLCVISGTGSLVCSRSGQTIHKSGGRGFILGDPGSAYQFGRDALIHYLDHRETASAALAKSVHEVFGSTDEGAIVTSVYRSNTPASVLARLAKQWGLEATNGDLGALESLERNLSKLAGIIEQHVAEFPTPTEQLRVCLAGGLWKGPPIYRELFETILCERFRHHRVHVTRILKPPVQGAVELAKEMSYGN